MDIVFWLLFIIGWGLALIFSYKTQNLLQQKRELEEELKYGNVKLADYDAEIGRLKATLKENRLREHPVQFYDGEGELIDLDNLPPEGSYCITFDEMVNGDFERRSRYFTECLQKSYPEQAYRITLFLEQSRLDMPKKIHWEARLRVLSV